jgi:2-isopropylmalate synthase
MRGFETEDRGPVHEHVAVLDTTLRDGEQSAGVAFSLGDKLEISERLEALGVDVVEAGFPTSCAADGAAVRAVARRVRDATVCALTRAIDADVDETWRALRSARAPRIHIVLSTSAVHLDHQLRKRIEQVAEMARRSVARARRYTPDVQFSAMDATRSDPAALARVIAAAVEAGASTINLPDTVGWARPAQVQAMIREMHRRVPELAERVVSFHGQDDLGLATANSLAAVEAGARQVELAVNGIGERAGNTSFEEVVVALRLHARALGVDTRVDTRGIWALSRVVEERSGLCVAPNKAVVGRNAFRHASGIHQDGVIKERTTYEIIDPAEIGHPYGSEIVLGKLSGRHGFAARVRALGIDLAPEALDRAFERFKAIAEQKREVEDEDLRRLCVGGSTCAAEAWPGPGV